MDQNVTKSTLMEMKLNLQKQLDKLRKRTNIKIKEIEELKTILGNLKNENLYLKQILENFKTPQQERSSSPATECKLESLHQGNANFPDNYIPKYRYSAHPESLHNEILSDQKSHPEATSDLTSIVDYLACLMNNNIINKTSNDMRFSTKIFKEPEDFQNPMHDGMKYASTAYIDDGLRVYNPIRNIIPPAPSGFRVTRKINSTSLLVQWNPPRGPGISGYKIYMNGRLNHRVYSTIRTKALLQNINFNAKVHLSLYAVSACGKLSKPAKLVYDAGTKSVSGFLKPQIPHSVAKNRRQERVPFVSDEEYRFSAASCITLPMAPFYPKMSALSNPSNEYSDNCHLQEVKTILSSAPQCSAPDSISTLLMPEYEGDFNIKLEKDKFSQEVYYEPNKFFDSNRDFEYNYINPDNFHEQLETFGLCPEQGLKFDTGISEKRVHSSTSMILSDSLKNYLFSLQQGLIKYKYFSNQIREKLHLLNKYPDLETIPDIGPASQVQDVYYENLNKTSIENISSEYDLEKVLHSLNLEIEMLKFHDFVYKYELNNLGPEYQRHKMENDHGDLLAEMMIPFPDCIDENVIPSQCTEYEKKLDNVCTIYLKNYSEVSKTSTLENDSCHSNKNEHLEVDHSIEYFTEKQISKETFLDNLCQKMELISTDTINTELTGFASFERDTLYKDASCNLSSRELNNMSSIQCLPINYSKLNEEQKSTYALNFNTEISEDYFSCVEEISAHDSESRLSVGNSYSNKTQNNLDIVREASIQKEKICSHLQNNQQKSTNQSKIKDVNDIQNFYSVQKIILADESKYGSNNDIETFWKASGYIASHSEASLIGIDTEVEQREM